MRPAGRVDRAPTARTARRLLRWFRARQRPLPWRVDRTPYRIWVAEVLLQQTRVAQAAPFFERFVRRFPDLERLAEADVREVLRVWQGAGYYARARHLSEAARRLVKSGRSTVPTTVEELEALPGVGRYTARAIAALATGAPVLALEANGVRVASRWWADRGDPRAVVVRRRLEEHLVTLMPEDHAGEFNEALMEFGETVCLPRRPRCELCPVASSCSALSTGRPASFPQYRPARPRPNVRAAVVVAEAGDRLLIQRRDARGLLGGLYEFPGGKIRTGESPLAAARRELEEETGLRVTAPLTPLGTVRHAYSHFSVEIHAFGLRLPRPASVPRDHHRHWASRSALARLPLPKATEKILALIDRPRRMSIGYPGGNRSPTDEIPSRKIRKSA